ncbi:MAG: hypothetical protein WBH71_05390 [Bacteroidales bacterium]|jgi:hypothetical protein|nr:hypothetical protein [Bacteroidales bacterium]MDI9593457.1 hypothetical protein [Bacteroidota bacterium]HOF17040.1 hypothetical protein [Bacteroidales bacterium]
MNNYSEMRSCFFKKAKKHKIFGRFSLFLSVTFTITSILLLDPKSESEDLIYLCNIVASFFLIIFWRLEYLSKKHNRKAVDLHSLELMQFITEKRLINLEIAEYLPHLKKLSKISTTSSDSSYYSTPPEINIYQRSTYRVLENCYWNKFLYKKTYYWNLAFLILIGCIFVYSFFVQQAYLTKIYLLLFTKILLVLLTSSLFIEFIYKIISLKNAYESMTEIYLRLIDRPVLSDTNFGIEFTKYNKCILNAPNIPNFLYKIYVKKLNDGWDKLVKYELKGSNTLTEIYNTLFIIKQLLEAKNKKINWTVTGSASSVIRSELEHCNDIDIIVGKKHVQEIDNILKPFRIEKMCNSALNDIRSYYGKYKIGGVFIDIMSNVENKVGEKWISHPPLEKEKKILRDIEIYITTKDFEEKVNKIIQSKHGKR